MSLIQETIEKMSAVKPVIKVLPSIPPNAFEFSKTLEIKCERSSFEAFMIPAKYLVAIRHKPTLDLISKYVKEYEVINEATVSRGELFIVVTLMRRTAVPGQDVQVSESDLMVLLCRNSST